MANLFSVKDKVVVITGGTGVLGKAIAAHLAEEGAKVILLGRKTEVGNKIVESIRTQGGETLFLTTDVLDRKILEQNLADILKAYGRIDALLNAAGGNMPGATISPTGDIFDLKIDEFQKVLDLNLTGTILPTQVFLKPMVEQRAGAIVNFSSMAAFRPLTRVAGYAAAKAGIIKPGGCVVSYGGSPEGDAVIRRVCREQRAALTEVDFSRLSVQQADLQGTRFDFFPHRNLELPLAGAYQPRNAAAAITALECLARKGWSVPEEALRRGLAAVQWPGRFEVLRRGPAVILDGAHNAHGLSLIHISEPTRH